jgi:UDPglucose 6-dehydrogenase
MKISVFGTGYVGLVSGVCFADMGNDVLCADVDSAKIAKLREGFSPIYEPGLDTLIERNLKAGRLTFTTDLAQAVAASDLIFIAVGTPSAEDGSADLKYVLQVAETIATHMTTAKVVVNKSTVPVGTAQKVKAVIAKKLQERGVKLEFDVVSNPEFLREGAAIDDCLKPSRVVVGCESEKARKVMQRLYDPFLKSGNPLIVMDPFSSEMTKYAANAMLATKISLMNEFSRVCDKVGADIEMVRRGIGSDPRIGPQFIFAGVGYGGSCFPKDVRALIFSGAQSGESMGILQEVENANLLQRKSFFLKLKSAVGGNLKGKHIALWGVAFKPETDDIREAPALDLIRWCLEEGATVCAYDPIAADNARIYFENHKNLSFKDDQYEVLKGADVLCLLTEWKSFREPDFSRMKTMLKNQLIVDGRNIYSPAEIREAGFKYLSIGRP